MDIVNQNSMGDSTGTASDLNELTLRRIEAIVASGYDLPAVITNESITAESRRISAIEDYKMNARM